MNEHRIVTEPASLIRRIARDSLKGHWRDVFVGFFIYLILTDFVGALLDNIFPIYRTIELEGYNMQYNNAFAGTLYSVLLTGAFTYGLTLFILTYFRTKKVNRTLLFEGFSLLGKTILLNLAIVLFVFLWALLFIIPGIIAAIRYSQAFYILADHPDYPIMRCIRESKERMKGNVGNFFILELSFIGWMFLAGFIQGGLTFTEGGFISAVIGSFLGVIPMAFLNEYIITANTVYYELLTGNLAVVNGSTQYDEPGRRSDTIHMVNADYQVHEDPVDDVYVAPEERESYNYAPRDEDIGAPREDDFGSPGKEEDDF